MASETVRSPKEASTHGCCGGGGTKKNPAAPAGVEPDTKPLSAEKAPAPAKTSGSCCGGDSHS